MNGILVKILDKGVQELLKGAEVQVDLKARADKMAGTANATAGLTDGFLSEIGVGKVRARARVFTATADAMVAEARDRVLTRAIDAGRG